MSPFIESGMTFGPYPDGYCFRIEQSDTYQEVQDRLQIAEFLLLRLQQAKPPSVWIVEAKMSSPRPETQPNFSEFIGEIREKLLNALTLSVAAILQRHPATYAEVPDRFKTLDLATTEFRLILIVNGHQKAWLQPLQDALRTALHTSAQAWRLGPNSVAVINHEDARRFGLTTAP